MSAGFRAAIVWLCTATAVPAAGLELLRQIEAELGTVVTETRQNLVTVIVPQSRETGPLRAVLVASGLALDDSFVVTAASVVADASVVEIASADHVPQPASVVGVDRLAGLALLRLSSSGARPAHRSIEDGAAQPGAIVFLVTSHFEDRAGCSIGVVTSVRPAGMDGQVTTEIEASAPAVPGSAGGVLVDTGGRVTGVVVGRMGRRETSFASADGGVLAVPVSEVRAIASELRTHGRVRRNWLGVSVQEMTPALREILGVAAGTGVIVISVEDSSPALSAGLEMGDVILSCDGRVIPAPGELMKAVAAAQPGGRLRLGVLRNGETLDTPVTLTELPAREAPWAVEQPDSPEARIRTLEQELARLRASLEQTRR